MIGNKLSVNPDKTEYLLFNSKNINVLVSIYLNLNTISPSESTKDHDVIFESDMFMDNHISSVVKSFVSFNSVNFAIFEYISSLNLQRLHLQMPLYIPALIIMIAFYIVFQSILFIACKKYKNSVARIVTCTSCSSHITPFFKSVHWLPVKYRNNFRLCCIAHHTLLLGNLII